MPEGFRETLTSMSVLSYRVLAFERDGEAFKPPGAYPPLALACVSTHDLPTLVGWWDGLDIRERLDLGLMSAAEGEAARTARQSEKKLLLEALAEVGLGGDVWVDGPLTTALATAIHAYIAKTPSVLALAQLEDLAGEPVAVNLPGTDTERPNWRRRIGRPLETLLSIEPAPSILAALRAERP